MNGEQGLTKSLVVDTYYTLDSGHDFARLILKQLHRLFNFKEMTQRLAIAISLYVIGEVKAIDLETGGPTQISVMNNSGVNILSPTIYLEHRNYLLDKVSDILKIDLSKSPDVRKILEKIYPLNDESFSNAEALLKS